MKNSKEIVDFLIECEAVHFSFDPPFTYTSGLKSPIYLDNRKLISYPKVRSRLVEIMIEQLKTLPDFDQFDMISATATAAIPMGALLADHLNLPFVYVRMKAKEHGLENQIEGSLHTKKNVLVIEDHISTAKSLSANIEAIRKAQGTVKYCLATTSYEHSKALEKLDLLNVEPIRLVKGLEITGVATQKGLLSINQKEMVDEWFKNPEEWYAHYFTS